MDGRAGILRKEIKMSVRCCDVCEGGRIGCTVLTSASAETSGPVAAQKSAEGRESSEVQRSRAVPVPRLE